MKFFMRNLRATRSGTLVMLVMQGAMFLTGVFMVVLINIFINKDQDCANVGTLMALLAAVFGPFLRGNGAPCRYNMAVSMGQTRRDYMLADPLVTVMNCLVAVAVVWVLDKLERWVYSLLYPGWEVTSLLPDAIKWQYILLFVLGICTIDFCLGALELRFGRKAVALVWIPLCFSPTIIANCVHAAQEGRSSLLALTGRGMIQLVGMLSPAAWCAVGAAVMLVLVALSVGYYRKAEVR